MKYDQIKNTIIILFLALILLITSFTSTINSLKINDSIKDDKCNFLKVTKKIMNLNPTELTSNNEKTGILELSDDIVVANETYNEYKPSMILSGTNVLVGYECENENEKFISIKKSFDYGQNWSNAIIYSGYEYNFTNPSFTKLLSGQDYGFGSFITPENSSYIFELIISSFSNTGLWNVNIWDYSNITDNNGNFLGAFFDLSAPNSIYFKDPDVPWIIGSVGDSEFIEGYEDFNGEDMPIFFYQDPTNPDESRIIVFFPEVTGCSNISISPGEDSSGNSMVYGVCEVENSTNKNLLFFHGNPDIWGVEDFLRKQYINNSEDFKHPKILADKNDIYISVETTTRGIVLYHSSNYGNTWNLYDITSDFLSVENPMYPILRQNSNKLFCGFLNSGNLSISSTYKSNINWDDPIQINDLDGSVEPGYNYYDIYDDTRVIWSDNRGGNLDIYYHLSYIPSTDLALIDFELVKENEIRLIPTKHYINIKVENLGDAPAHDIYINVSYKLSRSDEVYYIDRILYIDYLGAYQNTTIKRPLFRIRENEVFQALKDFAGMESMTVHVDSERKIGDTDRSNNIITKDDISFRSIFPILDLIEFIFRLL